MIKTITIEVEDLAEVVEKLSRAMIPPPQDLVPLAETLAKDVVRMGGERAKTQGLPGGPTSEITATLKGHARYGADSGALWDNVEYVAEPRARGADAVAVPQGITRGRYTRGAPRTEAQGKPTDYGTVLHILNKGWVWKGESAVRMFAYLAKMLEGTGIVLRKSEKGKQGQIEVRERTLYAEDLLEQVGQHVAEKVVEAMVSRLEAL